MKRVYAVTAAMAMLLPSVLAGAAVASADPHSWPTGYGQPIDYVIQRALSQRGVPYVYGGGNMSGPTTGARPGVGTRPGATAAVPGAAPVPGTTALPGTTGLPGIGALPGTTGLPGAVPGTAFAPGGGAIPADTTVGFDSSGLIQYAFAGAGIKMPRTSGEQCNVGHKVLPAQARPGDLLCYGPGGSQSVALYLGNGQMIEGTDPAVTVSPARTTNMVPYLTRVIGS